MITYDCIYELIDWYILDCNQYNQIEVDKFGKFKCVKSNLKVKVFNFIQILDWIPGGFENIGTPSLTFGRFETFASGSLKSEFSPLAKKSKEEVGDRLSFFTGINKISKCFI